MYTLQNFNVTRQDATLSNGIRVILFYRPNTPIYALAMTRAGSWSDPDDREGLAHFMEHVIGKGSPKYPSREDVSILMEEVGAYSNAGTNRQMMSVDCEVADSTDLWRIRDCFESKLIEPFLHDSEIEGEKGVVQAEIVRSNANVDRHFWRSCFRLLCRGTVYEHDILGTNDTVASISPDDVRKHFKQYIHAGNTVLLFGGDVQLSDLVAEMETLTFPIAEQSQLPDDLSIVQHQIHAEFFDSDQTKVGMFFPGPVEYSREDTVLSLYLSYYIGELSSLFYRVLRHEHNLVYHVGQGHIYPARQGYWGFQTACKGEHVQQVLDLGVGCFKTMLSEPITPEQVAFIVQKETKSTLRSHQTVSSIVDEHCMGELLDADTYLPIDKWLNEIATVTAEEMNTVAQKYIRSDSWNVAMAGRTRAEDVQVNWE